MDWRRFNRFYEIIIFEQIAETAIVILIGYELTGDGKIKNLQTMRIK